MCRLVCKGYTTLIVINSRYSHCQTVQWNTVDIIYNYCTIYGGVKCRLKCISVQLGLPIRGPSVVVQVGEEGDFPQVKGGDRTSESKSSLKEAQCLLFIRLLNDNQNSNTFRTPFQPT